MHSATPGESEPGSLSTQWRYSPGETLLCLTLLQSGGFLGTRSKGTLKVFPITLMLSYQAAPPKH